MDSILFQHIETTPGICSGKPRIAGTRIRVQDIYVWYELQGMSTDAIVDAYPHLTLADVHAALAYYYDHRDTIHKDIEADRALINAMKQRYPSKLRQTLHDRASDGDSLSS